MKYALLVLVAFSALATAIPAKAASTCYTNCYGYGSNRTCTTQCF